MFEVDYVKMKTGILNVHMVQLKWWDVKKVTELGS